MDKYEYKVRSEQIKALIAEGEYAEAAQIADTIDWRRVRSMMMLCMISDLYKINRRYEDARDLLLLAYDRRPGARAVCYALCELSIKMGDIVQAVEYYKEFVQVAPRDTGRYVLQYKLYEAQEVSLEERIAVLEELKRKDYREKWAYELAYLYHRVGLATRCVEECDELILWFGEGKYVIKAMELKMLHEPLTPQQQYVYDNRYQEEPVEQNYEEQQEEPAENAEGYPQDGQEGYSGEYPQDGQEGYSGEYPQDGREGYPQDSQGGYYGEYPQDGQEGYSGEYPQDGQEGYSGEYPQDGQEGYSGEYPQDGQEGYSGEYPQDGQEGYSGEYPQDGQEGYPTEYQQDGQEGYSVEYPQDGQEGYSVEYPEGEGAYPEDGQEAYPEEYSQEQGGYPEDVQNGSYEEYPQEEYPQEDQEGYPEEQPGENQGFYAEEDQDFYAEEGQDAYPEEGQDAYPEEYPEDQNFYSEEYPQDGEEEGLSSHTPTQVYGKQHIIELEAALRRKEALAQAAEDDMDIQVQTVDVSQYNTFNLQKEIAEGLKEVLAEEASNETPENPEETSGWPQEAEDAEGEQESAYAPEEENPEDEDLVSDWQVISRRRFMEGLQDVDAIPYRAELEPLADHEIDDTQEDQDGQGISYEEIEEAEDEEPEEEVDEEESEDEADEEESDEEEEAAEDEEPEEEVDGEESEEEVVEEESEGEADEEESDEEEEEAEDEEPEEEVDGEESEEEVVEEESEGEADEEKPGDKAADKEEPEAEADKAKEKSQEEAAEKVLKEEPETIAAQPEDVALPESLAEVLSMDSDGQIRLVIPREEPEDDQIPGQLSLEDLLEPKEELSDDSEVFEFGFDEEEEEKESPAEESTKDFIEEKPEKEEPAPKKKSEKGPLKKSSLKKARKKEEAEKSAQTDQEKPGREKSSQEKSGREKPSQEKSTQEKTRTSVPVEREKARVRDLTREEKELFESYVQDDGTREMLVKALDAISLAAYTGNVILTGDESLDTYTLAKNILIDVQLSDTNFSGKTAKITGPSLNNEEVSRILGQLTNGAIIIQKASGMNQKTVDVLYRYLQQESVGIIVILEDNKRAMNKFLAQHKKLAECFNARIDLLALDNEALAAFGRQYAKEKEYSIDEFGMLALHTRIQEMQSSDHAVSVTEVKEIVDEAIRHANRKTVAHFCDVLLAKRYDDEDMIILREKDFTF